MSVTRKLLICPYFGDFPSWMDYWFSNTERMRSHGYDFLHDGDEGAFRDRVRDKLQIEPPPMWGTGRIWNFRPALGLLYEEEIRDYTFWGHTDFDMVYGQVEKWYTEEELEEWDIHSNHDDYISGPWTLYRNTRAVNTLFFQTDEWKDRMEGADYAHGWAEKGFTKIVDYNHQEGSIRRRYAKWQTRSQDDFSTLRLHSDGRLTEGRYEVCLAHFRRVKQYPEGCKVPQP
jgi:hypothetical protein